MGTDEPWLDLKLLRKHLAITAANCAFYKRAIADGYVRYRAGYTLPNLQRQPQEEQAIFTQYCAIRALHRGRRHARRYRIFGPGLPNGTAVVDSPPVLDPAILAWYERKPQDVRRKPELTTQDVPIVGRSTT
jgi:hypothetical protein